MRGRYFNINKIKTIVICASILLIIFLGITVFEYIFLRLMGLQYRSLSDLVFFFIMYLVLEIPLSLITNAVLKALKSVGIIQSSKGWAPFILNTSLPFLLIRLLDTFMVNIHISLQSTLIFALVSGLIELKLNEKDDEPPMINSEEFKKIDDRFKYKQ